MDRKPYDATFRGEIPALERQRPDPGHNYPRISQPVRSMRPEYDVVVVGSGYGGGVAASRMARAGKSVAVLELGVERWPGQYPHTIRQTQKELQISSSHSRYKNLLKVFPRGKRTGMYHLVLGQGQHALVAHGLGGCSLINANVYLEADERTLKSTVWPPEIRKNPDTLKEYYERASNMLRPHPYPHDRIPPKKLQVFEKQARNLGMANNFRRVPLTTTFRHGRNSSGIHMKANTGSGQDTTGNNDGSKTSVLTSYITDAWNHGAQVFCECEVRYVKRDPNGNGFIVFFAWHAAGRAEFTENFYTNLLWVRAKQFCFLSAGALGTTEILLRSRENGLRISRQLGRCISGNGDMFAFGYNCEESINGLGEEAADPTMSPGPTITGMIDVRTLKENSKPLDGYVIEEGCIPEALASVMQPLIELFSRRPAPQNSINSARRLLARLISVILGPYQKNSSMKRTQTYLVMAHDSNQATLTLENDTPKLQLLGAGESPYVERILGTLERATKSIGGVLSLPLFHGIGKELVTVHPLGGAAMSRDSNGTGGVTNHIGQVFMGDGPEVYDGLICSDASVVPTSLGVNPLATITALSERSVALLAKQNSFSFGVENRVGCSTSLTQLSATLPSESVQEEQLHSLAPLDDVGFQFTEVMKGHIHMSSRVRNFKAAEHLARGASSAAQLYVSVDIAKPAIGGDSHYSSIATGTFSCSALSNEPMRISHGEVEFFSEDKSTSDGTTLTYKFDLIATDGKVYQFHGFKRIYHRIAFSPTRTWRATTELHVVISDSSGSQVGRGKLRISSKDFISQIRSFRLHGRTFSARLYFLVSFLVFFVLSVAKYFLGPFVKANYPKSPPIEEYYPKKPPNGLVSLTTDDGVSISVAKYQSQESEALDADNRRTRKPPILFIPGLTMDHTFYALPTVPENAIEYFTRRGHTAYVLIPRWGRTATARNGHTVFDSRFDVLAAVEHIYKIEKSKVYIVGHCQGSVATACALLEGDLQKNMVLGISASSVFMTAIFGYWNSVKSRTDLLLNIYQLIAGNYFCVSSSPSDGYFQHILNRILQLYPVGSRHELCSSVACHRMSFCFGRGWNHSNLNAATHRIIHEFMGGVHLNLMKHVARMGSLHAPLDNAYNSLMTEKKIERLSGVPILFLSGADNAVYDPRSTLKDYELLRDRFGEEPYMRHVFEGHGHMDGWIGKHAKDAVFWRVGAHIEWCAMRQAETGGC